MNFKFLAIALSLFLSWSMHAQVTINEYSASNLDSYPDDFGKYEDWIELYNNSGAEVDLEGWFISDKATKPTKWIFPEGVTIPSNGHLIIWCSGRDTVTADGIHSSFKLTQTKGNEILVLTNPEMVVLEEIPMELTHLDHSRARNEDGGDSWRVDLTPSAGSSNGSSEKHMEYLAEPVASLSAGFYEGSQIVTITEIIENTEVRYTLDGSEPTESSNLYEPGQEFNITETTVLKSRAFPLDAELLPSKINFHTYFIDETFTLPVFSVASEDIQDLANGQGWLKPHGTLEYFDKDQQFVVNSYGELNRHGQDSWILPHRSLDWISRDEMGYNKAVLAKLFTYSDRDEYQRFMFRASGDDNYPANDDFNHQGSAHTRDEYVHTLAQEGDMKLDVRALERVVVFLNGDYWGVYGLRERPTDHDYTKEYYDQGKFDIQYLTTWGSTEAEYGGNQAFIDWTALRDFILDNDMATDENYEYVKSQLQLKGLCDYMIANLNTVASDWLNYNTGWWRGLDPEGDHKKWGYILWDNDATFDYYINYSGVPNTDPDAVACDIDEIAEFMDDFFNGNDVGAHEKIFLKLLDENSEFQQLYFSRQADLINTTFSCDNMLTKFDSLIAIIAPEMPRQIDRWGGSIAEWQTNVQQMRLFIQDRCQLIDDGMIECYNLSGPHQITLEVEPLGAGEIEFNTLDISNFPWTGDYFGSMENKMKAISLDENLDFLYWQTENGSVITPDSTNEEAAIVLDGVEVLTAVFGVKTNIVDEELGLEINAFPTVFTDELVISLELDNASTLSFELLDINGRKIIDLQYLKGDYLTGKHYLDINLDNPVPSGSYFLQVKTDQTVNSLKLMSAQ